MFETFNSMPREPLPNDELSDLHPYASFNYTLIYCYTFLMVLIMDAYAYNKFCKSRSCFALGQANDHKEANVRKGPIFTNHVDKA
jgi:hypothetical protein